MKLKLFYYCPYDLISITYYVHWFNRKTYIQYTPSSLSQATLYYNQYTNTTTMVDLQNNQSRAYSSVPPTRRPSNH